MKLYYSVPSSSSRRVLMVLALKDIACVGHRIDLRDATSVTAHTETNPMGQVPVLEVEGSDGTVQRITQSVAISEYLEETFPDPPLLGDSPFVRAEVRALVELVNAGIQPLHNMKTLQEVERLGGDEAVTVWVRRFVDRGLTALEHYAQRSSGPYLVGKRPTLADVFFVAQLDVVRRLGAVLGDRYPALAAVEAACLEIPAFADPPLPKEG